MKKTLIGAALMAASTTGAAAITVEQYQRAKTAGAEVMDLQESYVAGLGRGYFWANIKLRRMGQAPLFCPPPKLALGSHNYLDMIDRFIKRYDPAPDLPIGPMLLEQLRDIFPCEESAQ